MNFSIFFPPLPLYHLGALLMKSNTFGGNFIDPNRQFSLLLTFSGLPPYLIHTELCWLLAIENSHWARQIPFCRVIFIRNRAPGTTPHSLSCLRFLVINHRPLEHTSRSRPPFIITQPSFAVVWVYFHLTSDFFHTLRGAILGLKFPSLFLALVSQRVTEGEGWRTENICGRYAACSNWILMWFSCGAVRAYCSRSITRDSGQATGCGQILL